MNKYYDIISKNRPKSKRPAMEREKRAAQFAPFKALEGHEDAITEKARYVMNKKLLSQDHLDNLNYILNYLKLLYPFFLVIFMSSSKVLKIMP